MTDITKLCDELEALRDASLSGETGAFWIFADIALKNIHPLIDAARESVKLRERIKELERILCATKANFLWPPENNVDAAGYEFANAKTDEYRKVWWGTLKQEIEQELKERGE